MSPLILNQSFPGLLRSYSSRSSLITPKATLENMPASSFENQDNYRGYDHATWYVGNAKQAASWYVTRMGFKIVAYQGLESGCRCTASYVVSNNRVKFVLTSTIRSNSALVDDASVSSAERKLVSDIHSHLERHGDAVKDVAFEVDDVHALFSRALSSGAKSVQDPKTVETNDGILMTAVIQAFGDTTHTFISRQGYSGKFLPGFQTVTEDDPIEKFLPTIQLEEIDHCVGNQDWGNLEATCNL